MGEKGKEGERREGMLGGEEMEIETERERQGVSVQWRLVGIFERVGIKQLINRM